MTGAVEIPVLHPTGSRGLPARLASHKSGGRDLWSPPLEHPPDDRVEGVYDCLREVLDPEIPISLVDLGLVYHVEVEGRRAVVDLTFTATACPCMEFIREDVTDRLLRERWVDAVEIREVWNPPWSTERISEEGRRRLRSMGVGTP